MRVQGLTALGGLAVVAFSGIASAATLIEVSSSQLGGPPPTAGSRVPGVWYQPTTAMGTAGIVTVPPAVEATAPGPTPDGAARLTTTNTSTVGGGNADAASFIQYGTPTTEAAFGPNPFNSFGVAATLLPDLIASYSYYRTNPSENLAVAPSFRIGLLGPNNGPGNDNSGTLIFEPYLDMGANPAGNTWLNYAVDYDTGRAWWSGGFGQPSGAGGPPIRTIQDWVALFSSDPDWADARITTISLGIGTFNPDQVNYFDMVALDLPGGFNDVVYDFVVPEPASIGLLGLGGLLMLRRRQA